MARILITGSAAGLGHAAAASLLDDGHDVVVHTRSTARLSAIGELLERGAKSVVGDLTDLEQVQQLAGQANAFGPIDAVIHNAGIIDGPGLLPVNVVAPYLLTALVPAPRHLYLSSSMHHSGRADFTGVDWSGKRKTATYSDSKLFVTAMMAGIARQRPDMLSHAVDPGWVPTRMGGPTATDDLALGHLTQSWLATTDDPEALVSGRYWHHRRTETPHPAVTDEHFQDELFEALASHTGVDLPL
ncbi:SDR family NAD(P)-dependent oxidoreductase [Streptomyces canus]|uniref:SDR family NAD(P)-dependent oxidoreductase n=1 Tax=Streptomyces canus TaxID=58343 RepID=UPI0022586023|nr:SDR family NAD(P)-dependent oxidoreductase [Streptomyces canus]MCX4862086.1 SDR family NAD(P)-dependent oxidoreductase [Streptomyces canus]